MLDTCGSKKRDVMYEYRYVDSYLFLSRLEPPGSPFLNVDVRTCPPQGASRLARYIVQRDWSHSIIDSI